MSETNKILFITLSNIGDAVLTLPALEALRQNFPQAQITVMSGDRPAEIFQNNPCINRFIVYNKPSGFKENMKLFQQLKKEKFDIVVDLRNSFFGVSLPAKFKISSLLPVPKKIGHMKDRHMYRAGSQCRKVTRSQSHPSASLGTGNVAMSQRTLFISEADKNHIQEILKENNIRDGDKIIVMAPGARSHTKRWPQEKFTELIQDIGREFKAKVILVGDKDDSPITRYISEHSGYPVLDLAGRTSLAQLAFLLKRAAILITNDSAVLHIASYMNTALVAIFGPTNELKYGPWSDRHAVAKKDIFCRPCEKAQCKFGTLKCLALIKTGDVLRQAGELLNSKSQIPACPAGRPNPKQILNSKSKIPKQYKRILIVRTDRIGDVLLSTPVIQSLREEFPCAYIAMMVSPYAKDIVEGNPYLDEVIIYDKEGKHKRWRRSMKFAANLKKRKFDLAVVLHPINRVHLITCFAGIPRRLGYDRKLGFLLTDRIKHTKQLGEKHELEYSLDLLRYLGVEPKDKAPFMPIKPESEEWVEELFAREGIKNTDRVLAIHPGASCPSKIWPNERFAEVADKLAEKYGFRVLVIAGPKDITLADNVIKHMRRPAISLAGRTSVSQLSSVLKRCALFISNDSGPVHIASAVGTPVISIFGRNQKGLSPRRWGPLGARDKALHKDIGCIECLAHNCVKGFACLRAITVQDILSAADQILSADS